MHSAIGLPIVVGFDLCWVRTTFIRIFSTVEGVSLKGRMGARTMPQSHLLCSPSLFVIRKRFFCLGAALIWQQMCLGGGGIS